MTGNAPSRELVHQRLVDLLAGRATREVVADWAAKWIREPATAVEDPVVWEALKELAGADLRVSPSEYLHSEPDYHAWLDKLELANGDSEDA